MNESKSYITVTKGYKKDYFYIKLLLHVSYYNKCFKKKCNDEKGKTKQNFYVMKKSTLDLRAKLTKKSN